jgi:hypothetical protein
MADRYYGTLAIGGPVTPGQFAQCNLLVDDCLEYNEGIGENGWAYFRECTSENFKGLIEYCVAERIALSIQWDADHGCDAIVQYWLDGQLSEFTTDSNGNVVVLTDELFAKSKEKPELTITEYLETLGLPTFPDFSIVE